MSFIHLSDVISIVSFLFPLCVIVISCIDLLRTRIFELTGSEYSSTPLISVNIPCKDDGERLEATLFSLMLQDYKNIEIIVAIDRSPELYPSLLTNEKYRHMPITFLNIDKIPSDWMGKQYCLFRTHKISRGDYILFIDSGEILERETLHHALGIIQARDLDHISVLPQIMKKSFFQKLLSLTVIIGLILHWNGISSKWISNRKYPGFGAFNMVRSRFFQQTLGYESLKMEVLDDLGVAKLIMKAGGKSQWFLSRRMLIIEWYNSLAGAFDGFNKNLFYFFGLKLYRALLFVTCLFLLLFSPIALVLTHGNLAHYFAIALLGAYFLFSILVSRYFNWGWGYLIFLPLGILIYSMALIWSIISYFLRDGIIWRGTHYSSKKIRQNTFLGC
jgi:glycosyltransferase involved in cell wall biosynthesis